MPHASTDHLQASQSRHERKIGVNRSLAKISPLATTTIFLMVALLLTPWQLRAQTSGPSLSGAITGPSADPISGARVTILNLGTSQSTTVEANSAGVYTVPNLAAGEYQVTVTADGFDTKVTKIALAAGAAQTLNLRLTAALSLEDLGISPEQVKGNPQEQARLDKRSHMLQIHQRLGLITTVPLAATVISGAFAGGKSTSSTTRDLHAALGSATAGLYFATAYYAIFAPKILGTKAEGPIRFHKALAWIHGPGMILTPILGEMAFSQRSQGERVHGIARLHGQVAIVTAAAYGLAILSVSLKSGAVSRQAHALFRFIHGRQPVSADSSFGDAHAKTAATRISDSW